MCVLSRKSFWKATFLQKLVVLTCDATGAVQVLRVTINWDCYDWDLANAAHVERRRQSDKVMDKLKKVQNWMIWEKNEDNEYKSKENEQG